MKLRLNGTSNDGMMMLLTPLLPTAWTQLNLIIFCLNMNEIEWDEEWDDDAGPPLLLPTTHCLNSAYVVGFLCLPLPLCPYSVCPPQSQDDMWCSYYVLHCHIEDEEGEIVPEGCCSAWVLHALLIAFGQLALPNFPDLRFEPIVHHVYNK